MERERIKIRIGRGVLLVAGFIVFLAVTLYVMAKVRDNVVRFDEPVPVTEGWTVEADDDSNTVVLRHAVTAELVGSCLNFYAYDSIVNVTVGGTEVYHYGYSLPYCKSPSSLQHFVEIPLYTEGQEICITIRYIYEGKYSSDITVYGGSFGSHVIYLLKAEVADIIISLALLLMSFTLIVLFIAELIYKIVDRGALILALLCGLFVLGSNSDLFINQLMVTNHNVGYINYFYSIYTVPLLLMCYLETLSEKLKCSAVFITHLVLIGTLVTLHMLGISELPETMTAYCIVSGVEFVYVTFKVIRCGITEKGIAFHAFLLMIVSVFVNLIMYLVNPVKGVKITAAKIGVCVYVAAALVQYVRRLSARMADVRNSESLKIQAYTDALTGIGNRLAYNAEVEQADFRHLTLFSFDVNNLKYYNDNFGHLMGDRLIKEAAELLTRVFGKVYRTGGDEFMAIHYDEDVETAAVLKQELATLAGAGSSDELVMEIACGYACYEDGDSSHEDLMRRADQAMYEHKHEIKEHSKIKPVR